MLLLALLAHGVDPVRAQTVRVAGPEVKSVRFQGNETFPDDSLERAIATTKTRCRSWVLQVIPFCPLHIGFALRQAELSEAEIPRDAVRLEIFYQRRGFREVHVEGSSSVEPDGRADVLFTIVEGRPVLADSVVFSGADQFAGTGLLDKLPIQEGDRWSTLALDAARDTLVRRLMNRGYPYADVLRQSMFPAGEPYHAHVTFDVEPGSRARYGDIRVQGLQHLSESTVLKTLPFQSGDPYRIDQLVDAQARLFGLDIVRSASITPELDTQPDSLVPLDVQVAEGDPYRVRVGAGWSTSECFSPESRWTSRNFFGGGRVLQVRGRLSNLLAPPFHDLLCPQSGGGQYARLTWVAAIDFSQPWIFSTRNSFNASVFSERQSVPDIFIRNAVGLQLSLVRAIGPRTSLTLSYRPELSSYDAAEVLLCTGLLICTSEDIGILRSAQRLAPLGLNLTRDLSNSLLNPTSGYRVIVDLEYASGWTGSEFAYDRAVVEGTWYGELTGSAVLATRLRGGWVGNAGGEGPTGIIPPQKRFYAGGANSVRGFAQSRLGPRVLVTDPTALLDSVPGGAGCSTAQVIDLSCVADAQPLTGDYGARFNSRATGGTRVVEGNVELRLRLGGEFEAVGFTDFGQVWGADQAMAVKDLELTPGFGVRYLSPVGPLRVDLGYNFRGAEPLSVVTPQIGPWTSGLDPDSRRLIVDGKAIAFQRTGELAVLTRKATFGESGSHFQLHISIGQAF
jgi:outer membrane protein insertion porin family